MSESPNGGEDSGREGKIRCRAFGVEEWRERLLIASHDMLGIDLWHEKLGRKRSLACKSWWGGRSRRLVEAVQQYLWSLTGQDHA